jgi:uncharacterized protein YbjT (DUF2867 family)
MYAITGATGKTGRQIAEILLANGQKVRALGHSSERLQPLIEKGAEAFVADVLDTEAMVRAYTGVKAAYILIPPNVAATDVRAYQDHVVESLATAIENAGVKHVIILSSVGADHSKGMGIVGGLHDLEERFNELKDVNVLAIRATFFMENYMGQIRTIKKTGMMISVQKSDLPMPLIASRDVAQFVAERLLKLDFSGKSVRELLGPGETTMKELATAIGKAIGREDLEYVQTSYDDAKQALINAGISPSTARGYVELARAFNEGTWRPTEKRSPSNTTPTTLEEFTKKFAVAYKA